MTAGSSPVGLGSLAAVIAACATALTPMSPACAQSPRLEADLSASTIEYDSLPSLEAASLGALAEWLRPSFLARLDASGSGLEGPTWSLRGSAYAAAWLAPFGRRSPLRLEIAGSGNGSRHSSGFQARSGRAETRIHLDVGALGAWAGSELAAARNSFDSVWVGGWVPNAGVWFQSGRLWASAAYRHARIDGSAYPEAQATATLTRGAFDLTVFAGGRVLAGDAADERWLGATATYWLSPHAAVLLTAGRFPSDVLQGLPGGRMLSLGVRVTQRRVRPLPAETPAPIVFTREEAAGGRVGFRLEGARGVSIAGDWTDWKPIALSQDASGRWILPALEPGIYRFNLLVDGKRWVVPGEVPAIDDGFGGRVGLLVISEPE